MKKLSLLLILGSMITAVTASAAKMSYDTQNMVIERLERVLSRMDKKDASYVASNLRLADLLAERARTKFLLEVEDGCKNCHGSLSDRKKALAIYERALPRADKATRGPILFQMAHLHGVAGDDKKATSLYKDILKSPKKHSPEVVTQARIAYADSLFERGDFKGSLALSTVVFNTPNAPNRGLTLYRMAWSQYNLGQISKGTRTMERLASSPDLLTKETENGVEYDPSFHNDVLRDLVTFYSRQNVNGTRIAKFESMLPREQRKQLLLHFGDEVARLGQKKAAADIYRLYLDSPDLTEDERLRGFMSLTQATFDQGQPGRSTEDFAVAAKAYKESRCAEEAKCQSLQKQMKRYVTELHRLKKAKPDSDVIKAYAIYAKTFPEDTEMAILGAQVAVDMKQASMARLLYRHAADKAADPKLRETALLGEIENAERARDPESRRLAYEHYMQLMPQGPKAFEVRYQQAHLDYEAKQWKFAAEKFRVLALDPTGTPSLRVKSADLALDALAIEKRDTDIENWSREFAVALPAKRSEYGRISRKAVLNQTASVANNEKASTSDLRDALHKMQTQSLAGATDSERKVHFSNQAILAERAGDDGAFLGSLNSLLAIKTLSTADREKTLARKVGYFEKKLMFRSAYQTALDMKFPRLSKAEKELRLGTLADLAGLSPGKHYRASLRAGLKGTKGASVRSRLVMISSNPLRELRSHTKELAKSPSVFAETVVFVYGKTRDGKALEKTLKMPALNRSAAARFIRKQSYYSRQQTLQKRIAAHSLDGATDSRMQRSIKTRVSLLIEADRSLKEAVGTKDFTAQVLALSMVSRENNRLVQDLFALPLPKGLSEKETVRYQSLLKQQARPYLAKSKTADQKLQEFWSNQASLSALISDVRKSRPEIRPILEYEVRLLVTVAPNASIKSRLTEALEESRLSPKELISARDAVRENPDDARRLEQLKTLENKMGHPLMAAYIEQRLGNLQRSSL